MYIQSLKYFTFFPSSGSYIERGGKDINDDTSHRILGGYVLSYIYDSEGNLIFQETSQGPEVFRPWFILPFEEKDPELDELCDMFENEILEAMDDLKIEVNGTQVNVELEYSLIFDSKLIRLASGLTGTQLFTISIILYYNF